MRQSNLEFIRNSFIALAMINSKIYDYRDWHVLSVPIYVSYKIGGDTDKFLKEAIKLTDNYAVERMQMEIGRNRGLQLFDEIETENGMGLIGKWHGKINSSYDLKRTAFEITKMIESDKKYLADDIDSADKLPKIWLSGVDDAQLEKILMGTRAGIQVSATLLPNIHPSHTYQVLWVQIYEFPNVEDVKVLFAISQKVKAVGYNMFAIKYDRLFCVVISRCVAQNCIAYETQGSIQRYKHKLIEIVKKYASTTSSNAP
ncbi:MAG TPA: hypothetical protein DCX53_11010 [Anaerolineae bacterium]|nr:hypothetical protein [Anaerolineae bacterium]